MRTTQDKSGEEKIPLPDSHTEKKYDKSIPIIED